MTFQIITADQRAEMYDKSIAMVLLGPKGAGKTSQLGHLPDDETLFVDLEKGGRSVVDGEFAFKGDSIQMTSWPELRNLACVLGGPRAGLSSKQPYSQAHYDAASKNIDPKMFEKYKYIFVDSVSEVSDICLKWAQGQCITKNGDIDKRQAYGLLGDEIKAFLRQWKHIDGKHVILTCLMCQKTDDKSARYWDVQLDGSQAMQALVSIFDDVICMIDIPNPKDPQEMIKAFITREPNPYGVPAKTRSSHLNAIEEPNTAKLINKIQKKKAK